MYQPIVIQNSILAFPGAKLLAAIFLDNSSKMKQQKIIEFSENLSTRETVSNWRLKIFHRQTSTAEVETVISYNISLEYFGSLILQHL